MDNQETMATLGTQDTGQRNTTQKTKKMTYRFSKQEKKALSPGTCDG